VSGGCDNETALRALRRGHVRWEQLSLRLQAQLEYAGFKQRCGGD